MKDTLQKERIKRAVKDILWMARRYADRRQTYSPSMFNDAYDILRSELGDDIDTKHAENERGESMYDIAVEQSNIHPYALYGDDLGSKTNRELKTRKYYKPVAKTDTEEKKTA